MPDMTTGGDETAALRRRLDEARGRIEALEHELTQTRRLESLGRVTLGVAHDLRNVMAAIAAQTTLLLDALPAESTVRPRAEAIRRATGWGERLTRELLAAGRPQPLAPAVTELNSAVLSVLRTLAPLLGDNVEVRTELEQRVGAVALGAAAVEQIAMNLILNARDAMPGGGRISICTAVAEHANGTGPERPAVLRVADTGVGMDEATRARAFEPYFTTKPAGKGTGLGLTAVHDVVARHGGRVEIVSEPGRGATVTVILPRVAAAAAAGPAVLVVVEENGVRELIVEILELHDFRVVAARDHGEAERLAPHAEPLALVIADLGESASAVRRVEGLRRARPQTRVLYLADRTEDASAAGVGHTLAKPFSVDALVGKAREVLGQATG
jgi:CheY-like chemotaxis protein/anti-sigma regulatory factor (Ser/Thr protein kinase)